MQDITQEDDDVYWANFVTDDAIQGGDAAEQVASSSLLDKVLNEFTLLRHAPSDETISEEEVVELKLRRTKRGRIRKEASEVYLQEAYPCGVENCSTCADDAEILADETARLGLSLSTNHLRSSQPIVVIDAPVAITATDFLWDDPSINNVMVLQTILEEVGNRDRRAHRKLLRLCGYETAGSRLSSRRNRRGQMLDTQEEVPKDRNFFLYPNDAVRLTHVSRLPDETAASLSARSVSRVASWLSVHLEGTEVVVLTDQDSRKRLIQTHLEAPSVKVMSLNEFIEKARRKFPNAGEKLPVLMDSEDDEMEEAPSLQGLGIDLAGVEVASAKTKKKSVYPRYLDAKTLGQLTRQGRAYQGTIRMYPTTCWKANVIVRREGQDPLEIRVAGSLNINRAVDGDLVVVRLLDKNDQDLLRAAAAEEQRLDGVGEAALDVESASTAAETESLEGTLEAPPLTGAVVGIVRRSWKVCCGSFRDETEPKSERVFMPANPRFPPVLIRTNQGAGLDGHRLVAAIDSWDEFTLYPRGHWIEDLGIAGTEEVEAKVTLREHNVITREFPPSVLRCLPPDDYQISEKDVAKRLDLRLKFCFCDACRAKRNGKVVKGSNKPQLQEYVGTPCIYVKDPSRKDRPLDRWASDSNMPSPAKIRKTDPMWEEYMLGESDSYDGTICCSIDPPTCVDIDDALSVKFLRNGNYEVGVHIADVTHYVRPDTAIDREAAERCTTVYLVNQRTDMLPKLLSADLCSLKSGVDRLSFSVLWEITPEGDLVNTYFYKTVMHSVAAFNYQQAQDIIDDKKIQSPIAVRLRVLNDLAKKFKKKRLDRGAVELAANEVKFKFDETGKPTAVEPYPHLETHSLVEEFMLLANTSVAERIVRSFPDCSVLRRHPPPKAEGLANLAKLLAERGFDFRYGSSKELAESLNKADLPNDPEFNKQLRAVCVQHMNQAVYFCTGDIRDEARMRHYALASDLYTHFTSPIRRYADVMVHRLLSASLNLESLPLSLSQTSAIVELCDRMSERHRNAQFCSRDSTVFYAYRLFKDKQQLKVRGVVTSVRRNGCNVQVPDWGVEGQAKVDAKEFHFDAERSMLVSRETSISVFDHVMVQVEASDADYRYKVTYRILHKI